MLMSRDCMMGLSKNSLKNLGVPKMDGLQKSTMA